MKNMSGGRIRQLREYFIYNSRQAGSSFLSRLYVHSRHLYILDVCVANNYHGFHN